MHCDALLGFVWASLVFRTNRAATCYVAGLGIETDPVGPFR